MNVLTDDECRDIYNAAMEAPDRSAVSVTRTIEAAVIKRLAAGVSVEPDGWRTQEYIGAPSQQEPYYNADTFTTAIAAARVQENERLAKHFDAKPGCEMFGGGIADEIRALLGKEAQS